MSTSLIFQGPILGYIMRAILFAFGSLACAALATRSNISNQQAKRTLGSSFGIPGDNRTFDYVIVGGGTAGLVIATRLVEANAGSVAVVEAGSFYEISNGNLSEVPATDGAFAGSGLHDWQPLIDWGYHTTPQVVRISINILRNPNIVLHLSLIHI